MFKVNLEIMLLLLLLKKVLLMLTGDLILAEKQ
nr:MAG TPA: hypothetical protein [Caudoviricetes sp.]